MTNSLLTRAIREDASGISLHSTLAQRGIKLLRTCTGKKKTKTNKQTNKQTKTKTNKKTKQKKKEKLHTLKTCT